MRRNMCEKEKVKEENVDNIMEEGGGENWKEG